jgi:hypothetical protein
MWVGRRGCFTDRAGFWQGGEGCKAVHSRWEDFAAGLVVSVWCRAQHRLWLGFWPACWHSTAGCVAPAPYWVWTQSGLCLASGAVCGTKLAGVWGVLAWRCRHRAGERGCCVVQIWLFVARVLVLMLGDFVVTAQWCSDGQQELTNAAG